MRGFVTVRGYITTTNISKGMTLRPTVVVQRTEATCSVGVFLWFDGYVMTPYQG